MDVVPKYQGRPETWVEVTVDDIKATTENALATGPFGSSISSRFFVGSGVPVIRGSNLANDGRTYLVDDGFVFLSEAKATEFKRSSVFNGDLIFTCWGTVNQVGLIGDGAAYPCYVISNKQMKFTPDSARADSEFLFYLFSGRDVQRQIRNQSIGSSVPGFNLGRLRALRFFVPPLHEQRAIAQALRDADCLIGSLEELLAKKRDLKQGAMQELLRVEPTDEVRLLGDVSLLKGRIGWQGLKQTEFNSNGDEPFLITGMNFKDGAIRWGEVYHISNARYEMAPEIQLRPNDVLMTKDGTIGKVLYIDAIPYPGKASLNSHLLLFRPIGGSYNPRYLYYQLSSRRFRDFVELSKSGTTFFGLSQAAVAAYPVVLPPMSRQALIAEVLSDMDTDITALEARLTKATRLKQGMMEELLTGKIRLA
jgi:type I restriction enzyme S subunit